MVGLVLLLAGCGGGGGSGTEAACDRFAEHAKADLPADDRAQTVRDVGELLDGAEQAVREGHDALVRTVGGSDSSYQLAADTFAQACFDAGWDG